MAMRRRRRRQRQLGWRRRGGSVRAGIGTERARGGRGRTPSARPPRELLGDHLVRLREQLAIGSAETLSPVVTA